MSVVHLIRHGETDWNLARRIQGSSDIPLNDTGRRQAREAVARLRAEVGADVVVAASDLSRARETAEIVAAEWGVAAPRLYDDLRERGYGEGEGLDAEEFLHRFGDFSTAEVPGAEPWPHLRERAVRGIRRVVADVRCDSVGPSPEIVVVSHGALIREVIRHATGEQYPGIGVRIPNGEGCRLLVERDRLTVLAGPAIA